MQSPSPLPFTESRHFSPWLDQTHTCSTYAHSIGMDGPHYCCQRHCIVVVMPCGAWERGAGCDDAESL
jgi:hypothetical protein